MSAMRRRTVLAGGVGFTAAAALGRYGAAFAGMGTMALRGPGSLPDPSRPEGTVDARMPFDHIVVVMQENHSFDAYFGMLAKRGQPKADGFAFGADGKPLDANPYKDGHLVVQHAPSLCQPSETQSWKSTHLQIDGGRMDGFAGVTPDAMMYWDQPDIPFYYSLASTFCLANRWFGSAPCQTYPNRRFLLAGTAFGLISTDTSKVFEDPPNGTIFDRLDKHGISWKDYFTDVPATGVIASVPAKHPQNLAPVAQFYADCAAGTLPAVSFVDSDIGAASIASDETLGQFPAPPFGDPHHTVSAQNEDEEDPADIALGENFVSRAVNAVLGSPLWPRILLVWTYDEHGGFYDHVPPPAAIPPDDIKPQLGKDDPPGGYDIYGPRVPAVVVSGYARRHAVTNVVHDHTSILATIEAKWNLPAMTRRDANAATLMDFLDSKVTFPEPPSLAAPHDLSDSEQHCSTDPPAFTVSPGPSPAVHGVSGGGSKAASDELVVRFYGRRHVVHGVLVTLAMRSGSLRGLVVELLRGGHVVAHAHVGHVGTARHRVALRRKGGDHFASGRYVLVVRHGEKVLRRRRVRLG